VLKHGKWLQDNPKSEEAVARDRAKARIRKAEAETRSAPVSSQKFAAPSNDTSRRPKPKPRNAAQLSIEDYLASTMPSDQP
jgi:hypothetical protein